MAMREFFGSLRTRATDRLTDGRERYSQLVLLLAAGKKPPAPESVEAILSAAEMTVADLERDVAGEVQQAEDVQVVTTKDDVLARVKEITTQLERAEAEMLRRRQLAIDDFSAARGKLRAEMDQAQATLEQIRKSEQRIEARSRDRQIELSDELDSLTQRETALTKETAAGKHHDGAMANVRLRRAKIEQELATR